MPGVQYNYVKPSARMRRSLAYRCSKVSYILTCPYFDDLEFDIFDAGGPECHFIAPVIIAILKLNLVRQHQSKPFNVRPWLK